MGFLDPKPLTPGALDAATAALAGNPATDLGAALNATYEPQDVGGKRAVRKDENCINVLDYGAVADGNTSTGAGTDNTTAFNAAVTAAKASKRSVYIPGGVYRTTDMIDLRGTRTYGDGQGITIIMCTDNTKAVVLVGGAAAGLRDLEVRHFSIPSGAVVVPDGVGVRIQKLQDRSVIQGVTAYNVTSGFYCYEPYADTTNYMFSSSIMDCRIGRFTHSGMYLRAYSAGNTGCWINNIYVQNGNGDGTFNTAPYGFYFGEFSENVIGQLNVEWGFYANGIMMGQNNNFRIQAIHFEQYRAKAATFNAFINIFGSDPMILHFGSITFKDCIFDQANVPDYSIFRIQNAAKITYDAITSTGASVVGTVTRRKHVFSPATEGVLVRPGPVRFPDAAFDTADFYQTALAIPAVSYAAGSQVNWRLYEGANGELTYRANGGTITPLAGDFTSVSANYTAKASDRVIFATSGAGGITVTLPTVTSLKGARYTIKKVDSGAGALTIATTSSQTIDGTTTKTLPAQYDKITVVTDGTAWFTV